MQHADMSEEKLENTQNYGSEYMISNQALYEICIRQYAATSRNTL